MMREKMGNDQNLMDEGLVLTDEELAKLTEGGPDVLRIWTLQTQTSMYREQGKVLKELMSSLRCDSISGFRYQDKLSLKDNPQGAADTVV